MPDRDLTRVLLASPHALERAALRHAIDTDAAMVVVDEAATGSEVVALVRGSSPDVAVVDVELPDGDGIQTCAAVKSAGSPSRVVVTSEAADEAVLHAAVEAGADGYVPKDVSLERFVKVIRQVAAGEAFVPSHMLGSLLRHLIERRRGAHQVFERFLDLTRREREVLQLLVDGLDQQKIAEVLVIAPETARTHIQNTIAKLGARSRLEAVSLAVEHGLLGVSMRERRT